jgi:hypothetical protein
MSGRIPPLLLLLVGCGAGSEVELVEVCPTGAVGTMRAGDSNGDGAVDLADPVHVLRAVADGGAAPACEAAVDLVEDQRLEADDGVALLAYLFEALWTLPDLESDACEDAEPPQAPACGQAAVELVTEASEGLVRVALRAKDLPVEGWSLSVTAEGCTLEDAWVEGTAGGAAGVDPGGMRELGYALTLTRGAGVTSAVVLDTRDAVALPADEQARDLLIVSVAAAGGCGTCTVSLGEAVKGWSRPVDNVLVAAGGSYPIPQTSVSFELCP